MGVTLQWRHDPAGRIERRYGETVGFGGGVGRCTGYMSHSDRVGPGVVVVSDAFGLHEDVIRFCDDLNLEGFTALAPDLYDGRIATSIEEADVLDAALDRARAVRRVAEAVIFLRENWHPRVGLVGLGAGAEAAGPVADELGVDALVTWSAPIVADVPSLALELDSGAEDIYEFFTYHLS